MSTTKRRWNQYNKDLVKRGSITFWIDEDLFQKGLLEKTKGRPKYHTGIIQAGWVLKVVYKLTFRGLQGFFQSLLTLQNATGKCPDYTLFCKRAHEIELPKLSSRKPIAIVIDASGLKIFGEGEWKALKHGREKKRRWIKIHAAVDPKSGECVAVEITDDKTGDPGSFPKLVKKSPKSVKTVYADGAYDTKKCRDILYYYGIADIIPPRKTGVLQKDAALKNRNKQLAEIKGLNGDYELWKKLKGYGKRSLAETFFSRLKMMLGDRLQSRSYSHQKIEAYLRVVALNKMAKAM